MKERKATWPHQNFTSKESDGKAVSPVNLAWHTMCSLMLLNFHSLSSFTYLCLRLLDSEVSIRLGFLFICLLVSYCNMVGLCAVK